MRVAVLSKWYASYDLSSNQIKSNQIKSNQIKSNFLTVGLLLDKILISDNYLHKRLKIKELPKHIYYVCGNVVRTIVSEVPNFSRNDREHINNKRY